jgi:ComEC/Rec2-related protein
MCALMALVALLWGGRLLKRWPGYGWLPVFFSVWGLVFALAGMRAVWHAERLLAPDLEGRDLTVVGVVSALPQRTEDSLRFRLAIETAEWQGQRVKAPPEVLLGWYAGRWGLQDHASIPALRAGERWRMVVRLKQPHGQVNPHGFDFELWMWGQGLGATGYVRAGRHDPTPVRLEATWQYGVAQWRQWMRDRVQARIADPQWSGLISALLMGDQGSIERADWDVFRATGVAHLVSISGLHVTMFAWLCGGLVRWAWRRSDLWGPSWCLRVPADQAARWAGLGLAVLYALFSGWGIPAQRTIWMLTWVTILAATGRRWPWPQVWLSACAWVLLADPSALGQAGFWLSFVAVGVVCHRARASPNQPGSVMGTALVAAVARATGDHLVPRTFEFVAVSTGVRGGFAGQCRGHSLGDLVGHSLVFAGCVCAGGMGCGVGVFASLGGRFEHLGCLARCRVEHTSTSCLGQCGGHLGQLAAGHALAGGAARHGLAIDGPGLAVDRSRSCAGRGGGVVSRHWPGPCGAGAHRPPCFVV